MILVRKISKAILVSSSVCAIWWLLDHILWNNFPKIPIPTLNDYLTTFLAASAGSWITLVWWGKE
jgi:hypothetical protein